MACVSEGTNLCRPDPAGLSSSLVRKFLRAGGRGEGDGDLKFPTLCEAPRQMFPLDCQEKDAWGRRKKAAAIMTEL